MYSSTTTRGVAFHTAMFDLMVSIWLIFGMTAYSGSSGLMNSYSGKSISPRIHGTSIICHEETPRTLQ